MADGPSSRRGEMKDSASFSETGSDIGDNIPQGKKDDDCENDNGFVEDRFRVDRKKLEQMLQGTWEQGDEAAEDFFQRMMDETNTQISWPSKLKIGAKSKKDPHIKVIGLPEDVREAKELLLAVLDTKSNRATLKMDVSHTDHSHVIGKGGNNIKRVMQETGCHIHFPDSNRGSNVQEKSNQVSIAGQPEGVETARVQIRELLPLVFMFELAATTVPQPIPDVSSPAMQQFQQQYRVSVSFRQRARGFSTSVIVRGSVCNEKLVKEATRKLIETLIGTTTTPVPVSMQLEIAPQHHLFIIGRGGMNIKQIMQATGAVIHFPDPNTVTPQRKGTVYIQGTIDSVFLARQHLIGCLPLVLMFDVKEEIDMDQGKLTQLMEQLDVFISVKPKPKQPSKSVIVKSIERNASNMYVARLFLMGLQKELPQPVVNQTNNGLTANALGLTALGYFGQTIPGTLTVSTVNAVTTMAGTNQILLMNGHTSPTPVNSVVHSPTLVHTVQSPPAVIHTIQSPAVVGNNVQNLHSPSATTNHVQSPVSVNSHVHGQVVVNSGNVHSQTVNSSVHHQELPGNHVHSAKVINNVQRHEVQGSHLQHSTTVINSLQRQEVPSTNIHSPKEMSRVPSPKPMVNSASNENSPRTNPASASNSNWVPPPPGIYGRMMVLPGSRCSVQNTLEMFNQCSLADLHKEFNQNSSFMRVPPQLERGSTRSRSETNSPSRSPCSSPHSFRDNSRTVDLAGLSTSNSFGKIVTHEPSLTNSGHTMDLLGLSKTTSPPMNEVSFLHSSLNGSLHSSLNRSSLPGEQPSPPDLRAPGIERKNSSNNLFCEDYPPNFSVEYERKKLLANKAMQQKAIGESRIPTDFWSGLGFSKSMPESAIRERMAQQGVKQRYESPMATTYENTVEEMSEIDRDPWKDSVQSYNRPINPAPGEYPSPRKKYEYGLSTSNHIDGALVPTKSLWSPKTDLAELFSKLGLGKYTDLFQQQEIDLQTFLTLTDKDLRELGISTFGARRKMLLAIADMNKRRTLQSVNAGFDGPGHMNNPFETAEPQHVSRSDIASMSGRW